MISKTQYWRSEDFRRAVAKLPCMHCGKEGRTQASHSNQSRDGKGAMIKAHDYRTAALCVECHADLDQGSRMSREERIQMWEDAHRRTIGELIERGLLVVALSS